MRKTCQRLIKNLEFRIQNLGFFIGLLIYCVTGLLLPPSVYAASPHLELSPSSGAISTSGTNIEVKVDTASESAKSAKAVIKFDSTKLEISLINAGTFFDEVSHNIYNSTGQVVINTNMSTGSLEPTKTGIGTIATMVVKAKTSSGTANMTFDCTAASSNDSGINDASGTDIINCSSNINGSYALGGSATVSASPRVVAGLQSTPSALPQTGMIGPTVGLLILGFGLILISIPLFIFI